VNEWFTRKMRALTPGQAAALPENSWEGIMWRQFTESAQLQAREAGAPPLTVGQVHELAVIGGGAQQQQSAGAGAAPSAHAGGSAGSSSLQFSKPADPLPSLAGPQAGPPGRRMAEAASGIPGGLTATITEATRFINGALPGLIHDKTHVFHSVDEFLESDYARSRGLSAEEHAGIRSAEAFFDPDTGHTIIMADNIRLREGESPRQAFVRVALHERVGHDGLHYLLGTNPAFATRWKQFAGDLMTSRKAELDAIAAEKGYEKLAGNYDSLALEWFARQAERQPALLNQPGHLQRAWQALRHMVGDLQVRLGLPAYRGRSFDDQVLDLLHRARGAALKGKSLPGTGPVRASAAGAGNDAGSPDDPANLPPHKGAARGLTNNDTSTGSHPYTAFDSATVTRRLAETPDKAKLQELGGLLDKMAERPGIFRLDVTPEHTEPGLNRTLKDSLANFNVPGNLKEPTKKDNYYTLDGGEALGVIKIREKPGGRLIIDSSKVKSAELSTSAYQAIYTYARHSGKTVVPDDQYLPDGTYRRVSHMLSSALRHGTTRHMLPHKDAKLLFQHWMRDESGVESREEFLHNVGLLAWQEARFALQYQPQLGDHGYDPVTDSLYSAAPNASPKTQESSKVSESGVKALIGKQAIDTEGKVGYGTAGRAMLLAHWLAQHEAGQGRSVMEGISTDKPAPLDILYSHPRRQR